MKKLAYLFVVLFWLCVASAFGQNSWIKIDVQLDNWPEETEWILYHLPADTIVADRWHGDYNDNEFVELFVPLNSGQYRIELYDEYGDGFYPSGYMLITNECQDTLAFVQNSGYVSNNGSDSIALANGWTTPGIIYGGPNTAASFIDTLTIAPCAPPTTFIPGCMDDEALNYDSLATVPSWGTEEGDTDCMFAWGCMDPNALNYDSTATHPLDNCIWPPCSGFNFSNASQACNGNQTELIFEWLTNGFGPVCDVNQIHYGYDLSATPFVQSQFFQGSIPIGATPPTTFPYTIWEVTYLNNNSNTFNVKAGGNFVTEDIPHFFFVKFEDNTYSDTLWITPEACIMGCTDPTSPLYNPIATMDDGSCNITTACDPGESNISVILTPDTYPGETSWEILDTITGNVIATSPNYNQTGIPVTTSVCVDTTMVLEFRLFDQYGDGLCGSCYGGVDGEVLVINPLCNDTIFYLAAPNTNFGYEIEQDFNVSFCAPPGPPAGCTDPGYVEFNPMAVVDDGSCLTPVILGCLDSTMFNYDSLANQQLIIPNCEYTLRLTDGVGDGWFGSYIVLSQGDSVYGPYTIYDGYALDTTISLSAMEPLKVYFYTQGNSITTANQCGIQLLNPLGDVTFGAGGSPWAPILTYPFKYTTLLDCGNNCIEKVYGCIDMLAINYDSLANTGDGSCYYNPGCTNPVYLEYDASYDYDDGSCNTLIVLGCMDSTALNYDPLANVEIVGSCVAVVEGCMNSLAFNYNPNANVDDGSCIPVVEGCTNPIALNYDSTANTDDNTCILPVPGCTDPNAFNFNPLANVDDSTCVAIVYGCTDPTMWNFNVLANTDNGSCEPYLYGCMDSTMFNYDPLANTDNNSCIPFIYGCTDPTALNFDPLANTNDNSCIPFIYGCTDSTMFNYNPLANTDNGSCIPFIYGCTNPNALNYNALANTDDGSCVLPIYGCTDSTMFNYNPLANVDNGSCIPFVYGCTDPLAYNYNPLANTTDNSCCLIAGCTDSTALNYNQFACFDDNSCITIVTGCTDVAAYNYNPAANVTDSTACLYDAGCYGGPGIPYWLNDGCYAWVIDVDDYCCDVDWDASCQSMYDYCQLGWPTNVPDISALGIVVYPNPTQNILIIETRLEIQVEVHDLMGKLLIKTKNVNRLDLSDLSNGLYNLSIIHEDKRYNKQIIKQ